MAASKLLMCSMSFRKPLFSLISSTQRKICEIPELKNAVVFRNMGSHGPRRMEIEPSKFEWRKFKDHLQFYLLLGVIPIALIIIGTNLFIGPAELIDIPEGYEPRHYEYYRHPISRFWARLRETPMHRYERHLHFTNNEIEACHLRRLEAKVTKLLKSPGIIAHKTWYMVPRSSKGVEDAREVVQASIERKKFF